MQTTAESSHTVPPEGAPDGRNDSRTGPRRDDVAANLHTHTRRCRHATGTVADYCTAAENAGLTILGISDHTPLPDGRWPTVRMDFTELPEYDRELEEARRRSRKLVVLKGMECEYAPEYRSFYREVLLGALGFDYLIGAAHSFPFNGEWVNAWGNTGEATMLRAYAAYLVESMASGLFAFMAHPDLFANACPRWNADTEACSREILQAAASLKTPLEINGYGLRKPMIDTPEGRRPPYPWRRFWETAADYEITVIANSDAHRPEDVAASIPEALSIAREYGLTVIEPAELLPARLVSRLAARGA